jgi:hypothetical protein
MHGFDCMAKSKMRDIMKTMPIDIVIYETGAICGRDVEAE